MGRLWFPTCPLLSILYGHLFSCNGQTFHQHVGSAKAARARHFQISSMEGILHYSNQFERNHLTFLASQIAQALLRGFRGEYGGIRLRQAAHGIRIKHHRVLTFEVGDKDIVIDGVFRKDFRIISTGGYRFLQNPQTLRTPCGGGRYFPDLPGNGFASKI